MSIRPLHTVCLHTLTIMIATFRLRICTGVNINTFLRTMISPDVRVVITLEDEVRHVTVPWYRRWDDLNNDL